MNDELAAKVRYVRLVTIIRKIRRSRRHVKLLGKLTPEVHDLRERYKISHDAATFESLKRALPQMRSDLKAMADKNKEVSA